MASILSMAKEREYRRRLLGDLPPAVLVLKGPMAGPMAQLRRTDQDDRDQRQPRPAAGKAGTERLCTDRPAAAR
jgi:hypothetical protein